MSRCDVSRDDGMTPIIADECKKFPHVPVDSLTPLQGGLKDLSEVNYNKLKNIILKRGIIVPFYVWHDGQTNWIEDGHQRHRIFANEGWLMDVPVHYISAPDMATAKEILLELTSQYGKVTQEGFDEFTFDMGDHPVEFAHFDALPFVFDDSYQPPDEWPEYDESAADGMSICVCSECGNEHARQD